MNAVTSDSAVGQEILQYLRSKLEIPENVREMTIRFAVGEVITVECQYLPRATHNGGLLV